MGGKKEAIQRHKYKNRSVEKTLSTNRGQKSNFFAVLGRENVRPAQVTGSGRSRVREDGALNPIGR